MLCWVIIAVVIGLQAMTFTEGYRRTADEVAFFDASAQGWRALATLSEDLAVSQGRLGLLFTVPLNALAAHFSDILAVRTAFVLLHFAVLALFAFYFSLISRSRTASALLLLLVTLQPVCRINEFMPPVTYPLQNSLPFLLLLWARCIVVAESRREGGGRPRRLWSAYAVFTVAMMTTEYAFLLGASLLFAEYGFAFRERTRQGASLLDGLLALIRQPLARFDAMSVALVLVAYFTFRAIYPSTYEGNVLDGAVDAHRVLATTFHRVWAGLTFSHDLTPRAAPWGVWTAAAVVAVATTVGLLLALPAIRSMPSPLAVVAGCLAVILYVSFPLAANVRQQRWCLEEGACGYLDSRLSYLAVAVIVLSGLAWLLKSLAHSHLAKAFVVSVSVALGVVAGLTFMDGWQRSQAMHADAAVWRRAALLACHPDYQPASDALLLQMIDSGGLVPFHPGSDKAGYWRRYLRFAGGSSECDVTGAAASSSLAEVKRLGPVISLGQTVGFTPGAGGETFLRADWSVPEPHGVWSDGPQPELMFVPRDVPADRPSYLRVRFIPYFGASVVNQTIEVLVNGVPTEEWMLTMDRDQGGRCCERFIALPRRAAGDGIVNVTFRLSRPRAPALEPGSSETRRLGISLSAMTLTDSRPPPVQ